MNNETQLWLIIGLIALIIFSIIGSIIWSLTVWKTRVCTKCGKNVHLFDEVYYRAPRADIRCSLHMTAKSTKRIDRTNHYRAKIDSLPSYEREKLKLEGSLNFTRKINEFQTEHITYEKKSKIINEVVEVGGKISRVQNQAGIYRIWNKYSNISYIGQSINIDKRWNQHKQNKFGDGENFDFANIDDFNFEVIMNCAKDDLNYFEAYYIAKYDSYHDGFNKTAGNFSHLTQEQHKQINDIATIKKSVIKKTREVKLDHRNMRSTQMFITMGWKKYQVRTGFVYSNGERKISLNNKKQLVIFSGGKFNHKNAKVTLQLWRAICSHIDEQNLDIENRRKFSNGRDANTRLYFRGGTWSSKANIYFQKTTNKFTYDYDSNFISKKITYKDVKELYEEAVVWKKLN